MNRKILRILIVFILFGLVHGAYVQLAHPRYSRYDRHDKKTVYEFDSQENLLRLEHYLFSPTLAPLVLTGTSMTGSLPTTAFRVPAESLTILGGDRTVLDLLSEQPKLPSLVLAETNNIMSIDKEHDWAKIANLTFKRYLRQLQTCFRPTVMLLTEIINFLDFVQDKKQDEPDSPPTFVVQSYENVGMDAIIQTSVDLFQKIPPSDELNQSVAHVKKRIDELNRRGTLVILLEMPMDPRIAATPHFMHIHRAMHDAFPSDKYPWIAPQPELFEYIDGLHMTSKSALKAARLIDRTIAAMGIYQRLGLSTTSGDSGTL